MEQQSAVLRSPGDPATNVAEDVVFMVEAKVAKHSGSAVKKQEA